jgi:hypothetical protein
LGRCRLLYDVLALSEVLRNAELTGRACVLSPELMSTTYWFLERFSKAYLVLAENSYSNVRFVRFSLSEPFN